MLPQTRLIWLSYVEEPGSAKVSINHQYITNSGRCYIQHFCSQLGYYFSLSAAVNQAN